MIRRRWHVVRFSYTGTPAPRDQQATWARYRTRRHARRVARDFTVVSQQLTSWACLEPAGTRYHVVRSDYA